MGAVMTFPKECVFYVDVERESNPGRTQHRKRWRGKRMSIRRKAPDDLLGRFMDPLLSKAIADLWRMRMW